MDWIYVPLRIRREGAFKYSLSVKTAQVCRFEESIDQLRDELAELQSQNADYYNEVCLFFCHFRVAFEGLPVVKNSVRSAWVAMVGSWAGDSNSV